MPLSTSDYVTISAAILGAALTIFGSIWLAKRQRKLNAIFHAVNKFKSLLINDIPHYESEETTFSACILDLYPNHKAELYQLLIHLPEKKKKQILKAWEPYDNLYKGKKSFGIFGVVMADLPHPDFGQSIEMVQNIERKQKKQVIKVLNNVQKML